MAATTTSTLAHAPAFSRCYVVCLPADAQLKCTGTLTVNNTRYEDVGVYCPAGSTKQELCEASYICPTSEEKKSCQEFSHDFCAEGSKKKQPCKNWTLARSPPGWSTSWVPTDDRSGCVCKSRYYEYLGECLECKVGSLCAQQESQESREKGLRYEDMALDSGIRGFWQERDFVRGWSACDGHAGHGCGCGSRAAVIAA